MQIRTCFLALSGCLFFSACADQIVDSCGEVAGNGGLKARFSSIQQYILTPRCATAGCHAGSQPPENMSLEAGMSYNNLVNTASNQSVLLRVKPGSSMESWLIRKLEGDGTTRMPLTGQQLSLAEIDTIRMWIDLGAIND